MATHELYVKVAPSGDPDHRSRELTLEVLKYIAHKSAVFQQMGITVQIFRVRAQDLQNARLIKAMQDRGIARLPALATQQRVYTGFAEIRDAYERSIQQYLAHARSRAMAARERVAIAPSLDVDDLTAFYENEMSLAGGDLDDDEEGIGKTDMMEKYRGAASGRESKPARRAPAPPPQKRAGARRDNVAPAARRDNVAHYEPAARRDNVAHYEPAARRDNVAPAAPAARHGSDDEDERDDDVHDDAEISGTIDRLSRDIDSSLRAKAFSATDDDDGENAQDDLMEQAFYANVSATDVD